MFENRFGLIEAIFVFGLAVAFYIWQMRDLKKANEAARRKEQQAREAGDASAGNGPGKAS